MLNITNLSVRYRLQLFHGLSFKLTKGQKAGLVGLNGSGKSTLLKLIVGAEEADAGRVDTAGERIAYLPQEFSLPDELVGEYLEALVPDPKTQMHLVNKTLAKLKFSDVDHFQEISTLSYGQKMKLYLAKLLISDPTVLLLDEPTNYLDLPGILWVEEFVKAFDGMAIIVSHDRAFLNNVVNKILEIDEQKLYEFTGNYDDYLMQKDLFIEKRAEHYRQQERMRTKFEERIKLIKLFSSGKKQAQQLKAARSRMEREVTRKEINAYKEQKIAALKLEGEAHRTKQILKVRELDFSYGQHKVLEKADFDMYGKEKVWFFGANGIGKSTLFKLIIGELQPESGSVKVGDNLRVGYFSQNQSHLDPDATLQEYFVRNTQLSYPQSYKALDKFLFPKDLHTVKIKTLSPGQRARLSFAIFAQQELDFLILDEPTNHLDIRSKEIIEDAFREYQGAMLLISHDRYFVENIGIDRTITIAQGKVMEV